MGWDIEAKVLVTGPPDELVNFAEFFEKLIQLERDKEGKRVYMLDTSLYIRTIIEESLVWRFYTYSVNPIDILNHVSGMYPRLYFRYCWWCSGPDSIGEGIFHNGVETVYYEKELSDSCDIDDLIHEHNMELHKPFDYEQYMSESDYECYKINFNHDDDYCVLGKKKNTEKKRR